MKRFSALILTLCMAIALLSGCGGQAAAEPAAAASDASGAAEASAAADVSAAKDLVIGVPADPESLIPWGKTGTGRLILTWNIYEYLFDIDGFGGEMTGILAKGYDKVDAHTYKVYLYENIHDADGNPITASDVKFSFDTCIELGASARNKANIESVEVADDYTAVFHFSTDMDENMGLFEEIMMNTYIVSQKAYEESGDGMAQNAVGTSGYKVLEYVPGSHITLQKTGDYWQTDETAGLANSRCNADTIKYVFITDKNQRAIALQTGQVDISSNLSSADLATFAEGGQYAGSFTVTQRPENKTVMMLFNCDETAVTNNADLRRALAYCFDSAAIVKNAYQGNAEQVYALCGNDRYPDYDPSVEGRDYFDYNLDTAKEYLDKYCAESGKTPGDITIRILLINESAFESAAAILQQYIAQLGLNCEILSRDNNIAETEKFDPGAYEIYLTSYANTTYMVACLNTLLSQTQSLNEGKSMYFIQDPELQTLLEAAQTSGATVKDVEALDAYINEQCYAVGICRELKSLVYANWINDIVVDRKVSVVGGAADCDWAAKAAWSAQ